MILVFIVLIKEINIARKILREHNLKLIQQMKHLKILKVIKRMI